MKAKKVIVRKRGYPSVDMTQHKTGAALIEHIRAFDRARSLRSGSCYIISGKEVVV